MRKHGLRGRSSPMNDATDAQKDEIARIVKAEERRGARMLEVRYSTYIGPGCAAEQGAITVVVDGRIAALVWKDGNTS